MGNKRLPGFVVIGAMKSGTTTLWEDLRQSPSIYLPGDKEPSHLLTDQVFDDGLFDYQALFHDARNNQLCGEASPYYTMLPDRQGVPDRALDACGPDLKLIYMVRDPLRRMVSQHHHGVADRAMHPDINVALDEDDRLINYSRYAMQAKPWVDNFGLQNICFVKFESFVENREREVGRVCKFLDIDSFTFELDSIANASGDYKRLGPVVDLIRRSAIYREGVRSFVSTSTRLKIRRLLGRGLPRNYCPTPVRSKLQSYYDAIKDDDQEFEELSGISWDIEATIDKMS